ncbi:MAG: response regulator transcription factor [Planctomycetota bacterium]|nr:MAG: response regulator transcription factor [Planctomycetota bacterium]
MTMAHRILLVEDDRDLAELARIHLEDQGYQVEVVHDGHVARRRTEEGGFDLVLLDLMLPGLDGLEICKRMRARGDYTPLLILTARTSEVDRILGLELGADEYLAKPVGFRELVARVRAILRRVEDYQRASAGTEHIVHGGLTLDLGRREVRVHGKVVNLTAKEFDLMAHFAANPGRVYTRKELLDQVWGYRFDGYEHTVNSHINRLRSKIEDDPTRPRWILTVWGVGYKLGDGVEA